MKCVSCGVDLKADRYKVGFACAGCGNSSIGRCRKCRRFSKEYTCLDCGFVGP